MIRLGLEVQSHFQNKRSSGVNCLRRVIILSYFMPDSHPEPEEPHYPERSIKIPSKLWSFETGEPFRNCLVCSKDLISSDSLYFINKCFLNEETLFELAICFRCHQQMRSELSESSLNRIQNYLEEFQMEQGLDESFQGRSFEEQISQCIIKQRPARSGEELQIVAYCSGSHLLKNVPAMMLTWEAVQDLERLLSKATRDVMDDFIERHLGPQPGAKRPKWMPV